MAAAKRLAALCAVVSMLISGCTYASQEPGLFPTRRPSTTEAPRQLPPPTNPALPVAGEAEWTTAEGLRARVRFAVHAVRRIPGATVVDWSVTPLSAPGLEVGDGLPAWVHLGLSRNSEGDVNMFLIDEPAGKVYRTLSHESRRLFNRCLCTPLWAVQQELRIGDTRLLQATFPALPETTRHVDVDLVNLAPFTHVPVTPVGEVPTALTPTDLARPSERRAPISQPVSFRYRGQPERSQSIQIDRVVAAPGRTTLEWTIASVSEQNSYRMQPVARPLAAPVPEGVELLDSTAVSGPSLRIPNGAREVRVAWMTTKIQGRAAYECLCSSLGLWADGLRAPGGRAAVASNFPSLPPETSTVDVVLPGAGVVAGVLVEQAVDADRRLGSPSPHPPRLWIYVTEDPPRGWATADWPTPVPDPIQLSSYRSFTEDIVALPDR